MWRGFIYLGGMALEIYYQLSKGLVAFKKSSIYTLLIGKDRYSRAKVPQLPKLNPVSVA